MQSQGILIKRRHRYVDAMYGKVILLQISMRYSSEHNNPNDFKATMTGAFWLLFFCHKNAGHIMERKAKPEKLMDGGSGELKNGI